MVPEPVRSPRNQPLSIGPTDSAMAGMLTVAAAIRQAGRGLVAADRQHDAVERVAVEQFDEAEIGEVAVERRRRALAGLLDRMDRELDGDAAGLADALAHALGELEMVPVARAKGRSPSARCR